jgi:hypothetical protein
LRRATESHKARSPGRIESFYNNHRPHQALGQTALLKPLPDNVIDLDEFRVTRRDRIGVIIHAHHLAA